MARVDEHLIWRDECVSVLYDEYRAMSVYLNAKGDTKVVNYDDNFYSIYEDIEAYEYMLAFYFDKEGLVSEDDRPDYQRYLDDFIYDQIIKEGIELDFDYLKERGINYYGKR